MRNQFRFKQFTVSDELCAMKLTTDAVVLGALSQVGNSLNILDIGTGCGILSLMMAQKSQAMIDAVDIDEKACMQARQNFMNSDWAGRLQIYHLPIQIFAGNQPPKYDLIISNPPYFQNRLLSHDELKNLARHSKELSFNELNSCVCNLLLENGQYWVVIPSCEKKAFITSALSFGLFPQKMTIIKDNPTAMEKIVVLCLSKLIPGTFSEEILEIKDQCGQYSLPFRELTKEFYPDF